MSGRPPDVQERPLILVLMNVAFAIALALLVITAVAGTAVALSGATEAAWLIWAAGGIASISIVALAPWVYHFFTSGENPDPG